MIKICISRNTCIISLKYTKNIDKSIDLANYFIFLTMDSGLDLTIKGVSVKSII